MFICTQTDTPHVVQHEQQQQQQEQHTLAQSGSSLARAVCANVVRAINHTIS